MPDFSDNGDATDTFEDPVAQARHDELVRSLRQLAEEFPELQSANDPEIDFDIEVTGERDSFDLPPLEVRHDELVQALRDLCEELERDIEADQQP